MGPVNGLFLISRSRLCSTTRSSSSSRRCMTIPSSSDAARLYLGGLANFDPLSFSDPHWRAGQRYDAGPRPVGEPPDPSLIGGPRAMDGRSHLRAVDLA